MQKVLKLLLSLVPFCLIVFNYAYADISIKTNRSPYVYDQEHILSNKQVQQITNANNRMKKNNNGIDGQVIYLYIYKGNPDKELKFSNNSIFTDDDKRISAVLEDNISNTKYPSYSVNVIAYNMSTGKTSFCAGEPSSDIDNWSNKFWHKRGLTFSLHSHVKILQAKAITKYTLREAKTLKHYNRTGHYYYATLMQLLWTILIFIFIAWILKIIFGNNYGGHDDSNNHYDDGYFDGMIDSAIIHDIFDK